MGDPHREADSGTASGSSAWFWLLGVAAVVAVAYLYRSLALPLLLASLVAYLLNPIVVFFVEHGVRRGVVVAGIFLTAALLLTVSVSSVVPLVRVQSQNAIRQFPAFSNRIELTVNQTLTTLRRERPYLQSVLPEPPAPGWSRRLLAGQTSRLEEYASQAGAVLALVLLVPIFSFFLLRDGGKLLDSAVEQLAPQHIETTVAVWCAIDRILGRYLRGLMIESLVVGVLATIGLWILGVPAPLLLGLFTALINPIPYVGALTSVALASLVALAAQLGTGTVVGILALYAGIRLLDDVVIVPLTVGGSVHLHPALVIASIVAGEHLLGVLGMVLAVLTVTIVKEVTRLLLEHRRNLAPRSPVSGFSFLPPTHFLC